MSNGNQFDWVQFYKELASKLLQYKSDRQVLIGKILQIYEMTGLKIPTMEKDNNLVDIDPFTIFGLFNKKLTDSNRIAILKAIAELFGISSPVPQSFESLPVLNPQNAIFYPFITERGDTDIDELWELFHTALIYAENPSNDNRTRVAKHFDKAVHIKNNGNSKITMGLYWIAPDAFLNLDQRNTWYIYESGKIPPDIVKTLPTFEAKISAEKYFDIVEKLRIYLQSADSKLKNFMELSLEAWCYSEEVNKQNAESVQLQLKENGMGASVADQDVETVHYWMYSPGDNASIWEECYEKGIMAIGWDSIGDLTAYESKNAMKEAMKKKIDPDRPYTMAAHATWQFTHDMKRGDIVFAKKGRNTVIGRGIIESDYVFDDSRKHYKNVRKVKWTDKGEWAHPGQAVMKTLTDITPYTEYVEKLSAMFSKENVEDAEEQKLELKPYSVQKFLEEVYMDEESYQTLVDLVRSKKNVILQGAPGVGKTFVAKRLAYSMMGVKDPDRVLMIQFHQSYSYEDFIMGFRPSEKGFELRRGAFYDFCKVAEIDSDNEYFFIIDEINRGNLSKIFGELFMLIEADKRGIELQLLYSDEKFSIPQNVYIVGMMNTADRSLAMMDYALRRRFGFFEIRPGFHSDQFRTYRMKLGSEKFDKLIDCVENLNNAIINDDSLGEGFCIGHSYFCNLKQVTDRALHSIVEFELIPLLKEYWFDEPIKVKDWINNLRSAIK